MVELICGNLLEAEAQVLVNPVNCAGVMGKGLALAFKRAWPENFRVYRQACRSGRVQPGQMLTVPTGVPDGPRFIINFPTKRHWRGPSRLEDVEAGLGALVEELRRLGVESVAIPALGCGLGGLPWDEVRPRIIEALSALPQVRALVFEPANERDSQPHR